MQGIWIDIAICKVMYDTGRLILIDDIIMAHKLFAVCK